MGLISRGTGIQVNNWLLITILTIVFLGTMYPLATDLLLNKSLTVGPKYYSTTIAPIIILFFFLCLYLRVWDGLTQNSIK